MKNSKYDLGILGVHGIGHQKEGDTYKNILLPIINEITELCNNTGIEKYVYEKKDSAELEINSNRAILEEATWTPNYESLPKRHILWVLENISIFSLVWGVYKYNRKKDKNVFNYSNLVFSMLVTNFIILIFGAPVLLFSINNTLIAIILIIGLIITIYIIIKKLYLKSPTRLVHAAAVEDHEIQIAITKIEDKITDMLNKCKEIVVIAHSQGGYMTYRALLNIEKKNKSCLERVSFYGIGSGIAPILLMKQSKKILKYAIFFAFILMILSGILSYYTGILFFIQYEISEYVSINRFTLLSIALTCILVLLASFCAYHYLGKHLITNSQISSNQNLQNIKSWEEYSAPEDMVGRSNILFQKNSKISHHIVPIDGYSILTHLKYFIRNSIIPKRSTLPLIDSLLFSNSNDLNDITKHILNWCRFVILDRSVNSKVSLTFGTVIISSSMVFWNKGTNNSWISLTLVLPVYALFCIILHYIFSIKRSILLDAKSLFYIIVDYEEQINILRGIQIFIVSLMSLIYVLLSCNFQNIDSKSFLIFHCLLLPTAAILYIFSVGIPLYGFILIKYFTTVIFIFYGIYLFNISLSIHLNIIYIAIVLFTVLDTLISRYMHYHFVKITLKNEFLKMKNLKKYKKFIRGTYRKE